MLRIKVKILSNGTELGLPSYASEAAAGYDLRSADDNVFIEPFHRKLIRTGIALELPDGLEAQIRPRSGLALKHGVTVLNAPGTIDADYRGEIGVILINHGDSGFFIRRGDRIAQMVIKPTIRTYLAEAETLSETARGDGGFGSTGT